MKKIFFIPLICLFFYSTLFGQTIIDEDFLELIQKNADPLWAQGGTQFANSIVPEKYKKESAVIFGFKRELSIDKKTKSSFFSKSQSSLLFYENIRFKIKLQDRSAVSNFTEFYFRYSDKEDGFSAKVTKQDGTTTTISLNGAVKIESSREVPEFFKSFFDQEINASNRYFKVAIPDLVPNDILEYVSITKSKLDVRGSGLIEFNPQYELCSKKYPILFNQIGIETDDKSYFKALSKNGAPQFKKEASNNSEFFRYVFADTDRATEKDVNFVNSYRQFPFIKFQLIYSNKENAKGTFIGDKGEIKSQFTKEELAKKAWEEFSSTGTRNYLGNYPVQAISDYLWKELKKLGAKDMSEEEYINNVYYRIRSYVIGRDYYLPDKVAAFLFGNLLYQKDIKSQVIITVNNSIGELKDIIFEDELRYVIKVGDKLYFNPTDHSNPGDLSENLLGSESYIISEPNKKTGVQDITPFTLPNIGFDKSSMACTVNISLKDDLNTIVASNQYTYKGISKNRNITDALRYTPYMIDDYVNYNGDDPTAKMKAKEQEKYDEDVATLKKNYKEAKEDYVKSQLQNDYGKKVVYKNFTIQSDGRSLRKNDLTYTEDFEIKNFTRKAGKRILLNLPGLVGSQLQFKKEERIRKNDIDVDYARSLNWVINFKIPDGYTLEGLPELAINVDNEIGTYTCTASQTTGTATILIKKVYKKATFSKTKWNDMLNFVDAAFNTSFKNVLLKPNK